MTLNGAITELIILRENSSMPDYFIPSLREIIETLKTEAKPVVKGRWEEKTVKDPKHDPYGILDRRFYCSACGEWQTYGKTRYCPDCGAEMEVEEMEEET